MPESTNENERIWVVVKNGVRESGPMTLSEANARAASVRSSLNESEQATAQIEVVQNLMG